MSMVTRCPSCGTTFRITQEQLRAREGRVRCGRCAGVFDARGSLDALDIEEQPREAPAGEEERAAQAAADPRVEAPLRDPEPAPAPEAAYPPAAGEARPTERDPVAAPVDATEPAAGPAGPPPEVPAPAPEVAAPQPVAPAPAPPFPIRPRPASRPRSPPTSALDEEISFGRPERARTSPWWWPASGVLLLLLVAQLGFHFRGELAIVFPSLTPTLAAACEQLGCSIPLPRRAELMSIESSDLQADGVHPSVMVLSATLRNRAAFPQGYPALELTLTNAQDLALARRVLYPADYLSPAPPPASAFAAQSEVPVKVYFEAAALNATGYRLYLFHP